MPLNSRSYNKWWKIPCEFSQWFTIHFPLIQNGITYHLHFSTALPFALHWLLLVPIHYHSKFNENIHQGIFLCFSMITQNESSNSHNRRKKFNTRVVKKTWFWGNQLLFEFLILYVERKHLAKAVAFTMIINTASTMTNSSLSSKKNRLL